MLEAHRPMAPRPYAPPGFLLCAGIDSLAKVLYARHADQRKVTFTATLKMGEEYTRGTRALLLRINLMRADFIVKGEVRFEQTCNMPTCKGLSGPPHAAADPC